MSEFTRMRLSSQIQETIGRMILDGTIKNPHVSHFVSISHVEISKDYAYAKLYVSTFEDEAKLMRSVEALNQSAGFIQSRLAKNLRTRNTPVLTFVPDTTIRDGMKMHTLIDSLDISHD